ncbi:hypothetical protein ABEW34_22085 [Paenibacillus algorifonticola]|uniref:hypothetical protein n=1 Tax=Paenibacillus algorifonticola TaxID=684063 RepID=UPI003D27CBA6
MVLKIIAIGCLVNGMLFTPHYWGGEKSFAEQALFFGKYFGITAVVIFILGAMVGKVDRLKQEEYWEWAEEEISSMEQRLLEVNNELNELKRARLGSEHH